MGKYTIVADGENLAGLWLDGQKYFMASIQGDVEEKDSLPVFVDAKKWLDAYFAGKAPALSELSLAPGGGAFRKAVWDMLCDIPYGQYVTYGEIAKKMAEQTGKAAMSSQAVGGAVGRNPLSIIIPCHRVVGSNGSLTGYAGGLDTKIKLLRHEGVDVSRFFIPKKTSAP